MSSPLLLLALLLAAGGPVFAQSAAAPQTPPVPPPPAAARALPPTTPPFPAIGPTRKLRLRDALALTMQQNPAIRLQAESVVGAQGQRRSAAGPFDPVLQAQVNRSFSRSPGIDPYSAIIAQYLGMPTNPAGYLLTRQDNTSATVGIQKTFRNGISFSPQISLTRDIADQPGEVVGTSSILGFTLNIPLLQGLGPNSIAAATERAAIVNVEINRLTLEFTIAQQLYNTINAYWNCLLAQENVRISRANENAASRLVEITRALIEGYVQPDVQIAQARANLEQYASQRMLAEQQQAQASQQLAIAIGMSSLQLQTEPLVVDTFPAPKERGRLKAEDIAPLIALASGQRRDLMAAVKTEEANAILLKGVKNSALPQLDVTLGAGYAGIERGNSLSDSLAALNHNLTGVNMSGGVSFALPLFNDAAQGRVIQQRSQLAQARTQTFQQKSQVASDVITAAKSVINTERALAQAEASARHLRVSVDAQEKLFAMGMSSIVEVITTQTNLANAELNVATNQAQYAIAVAQIRFATGTLLPENADDIYRLDTDTMMRIPKASPAHPGAEGRRPGASRPQTVR